MHHLAHTHLAALLATLAVAACGPLIAGDDDSSTGSSGDAPSTTVGSTATPGTTSVATTTPGTSTSATTIDPDPDTGTSGNADTGFDEDDCGQDCCGFLCPPEESGDDIGDCDVWEQDCPEQEKCMPWANDGSWRWNASRCSPLAEDPGLAGEPCAVEGSGVSGIDDCGLGLMCFWVDPLTDLGTCVPNCTGSEANPICEDPVTACVSDFDGVFNECLPQCDPLLQDCEGSGCLAYGDPDLEWFACAVPIADPIVADFEPCDHHWACQPGSLCTTEKMAPSCDDGRCCAPLCDLSIPNACGDGYACVSVFDEGELQPAIYDVGYCALQ